MEQFTQHTGLILPLDRENVDTDAIIPKQYLKSIKRTGFGPTLFDDWRYLTVGEPGMDHSKRALNSEFVLNQPEFAGASILLARKNFGCGSSREHAVWALAGYGFRVVIAPSFADIFFNNSFKSGLLPIVLDNKAVDFLFDKSLSGHGYSLTVNLEQQQIVLPNGDIFSFEVDRYRKYCLLNGFDDIALTLKHTDVIKAYEKQRKQETPWLFPS